MIESLHISNYALIDNIDIDFHQGLNIITGETGAGKSILLGALSMLLGARADSKVVRDCSRKSIIEAHFSVEQFSYIKSYCEENDIEWDDMQCILRREISTSGRSRAFVNDSPVSLTQLQTIASQLIDIHSQHQNRLISSPGYQLKIIDSLANNTLLQEYNNRYELYRDAIKKLKTMRALINKNNSDEEFMRFQLKHLEDLHLVAGEQAKLEKDRELLSNITEIKRHLNHALSVLSIDNTNALSNIKIAVENCSELTKIFDEAESLRNRLESARIEIQDISETLSSYDANLVADPQMLEDIDQRLSDIYTLQRRHNVDSVEDLISIREGLKAQLNALENSDESLKQLELNAKQALLYALDVAKKISVIRKKEAKNFATLLKAKATPLGMKNLQCDVKMTTTTSLQANGIDNVEFLFAFNKNQQLLPVDGTASGGEISRLMLSIKSIVADKMQLPSIIFDEVDTGVSGDVANRMGEMMQSIAKNIQVIAITHLPQVAAKGSSHYKVYKEDDEKSTQTRIQQLNNNERIEELAIMLSGSKVEDSARANARSLLNFNS